MAAQIILASSSPVRATLLRSAGLTFGVLPARVDEPAIRAALLAEAAKPRDIADAMAEFKARKVAERERGALVIGCDQVLEFAGGLLGKAKDPDDLLKQLAALSGQPHHLHSAVVVYDGGRPVWRHVGSARLQMRPLSALYMQAYVARNWKSVRHAVGGYKLEEEGVRLFSEINGDYFTVLGLPLLELINYLVQRRVLAV